MDDFSLLFGRIHDWALVRSSADLPGAVLETAGTLAGPPGCVVVSACLAGIECRYDGDHKRSPGIVDAIRSSGRKILPLCPEVLSFFGVPRPPMKYHGNDLLTDAGQRCGDRLRAGAARADRLARACKARVAVLKERSPSCAVRQVHTVSGPVQGMGMFTALLVDRGVVCVSEEEPDELAKALTSKGEGP